MSNSKHFSFGEILEFGYHKWKTVLPWMALIFLLYALSNILQGILVDSTKTQTIWSFLLSVVFYVISLILSLGLIRVGLDATENKKPNFKSIYNQYHNIISYFVFSLLYGIMIIAGFVLLIVPGIILSVMFSFGPYIIVDQKVGPITALKESYRITKGAKWNIFVFNLITFVLTSIIPVAAAVVLSYVWGYNQTTLVIWSIITIASSVFIVPIVNTAFAKLYKELKSKTK